MNKHLVVIALAILLILTALCGCIERKIEFIGDTEKVEMVEYTVEVLDEDMNKIGDSFDHGGKAYMYKINGTVRNIAGERISRVWVSVKLTDRNDNYLASRTYLIPGFPSNDIKNFSLIFTYSEEYFEKIWNIYFVYVAVKD